MCIGSFCKHSYYEPRYKFLGKVVKGGDRMQGKVYEPYKCKAKQGSGESFTKDVVFTRVEGHKGQEV